VTDVRSRLQEALEGRYLVERQVGQGGMGVVFLAQDLRHHRPVAVKVMRPELAEVLDSSRFVREIMTAARMTHPGILPVHDSGSHNGLMYFVMPYVDGGSLRALLERRVQLPLEQALRFATELGEALAYAHRHGVVHRDFKPENVLLEGGRPVIADFGVARAIGDDADGAHDATYSVAVGTPHYMSPEQALPPDRTGRHLDGRADLYALACVLYEMLAGDPPFTGATVDAIVARKLSGEFPSLRIARPIVPKAVADAIAKAMAPTPADRFDDVEGFLEAIRPPPRLRSLVVAAATAAVLTTAAGVGWLLAARGSPIDRDLIVVDRFENRTGDTALAALGLTAADWITSGLHGTRLAGVVPTPSAIQASRFVQREAASRAATDPLALLAKETGAGLIISGAYYLFRDQLTFQVQVSQASSSLWQRLVGRGVHARLHHTLEPVVVDRDSTRDGIVRVGARVMGWLASSRGETEFSAPDLARLPPTYDAYQRFTAGLEAYVADERHDAGAAFLDAWRRDTTFVVALLYAALNASNLRQYAAADSMLRVVGRAADRLTPYHRLWLGFRQALLSQDRPAALRAVRALAAEAPRSKATYNLAIEAWENGHLEEARDALERLTPDVGAVRGFLPYWGALANVHHLLGDYRAALETARRAQRAHPGMLFPVGWELAALAALGRTGEVTARTAEVAHLPADAMGWTPAQAIAEAAGELRARGHDAAAREAWEAVLTWYDLNGGEAAPSPRDRLGRAEALYALGRYDEAEHATGALLATDPEDIAVVGLHGRIAARRGDAATAAAVHERLLAMGERPYQFGRPFYQAALIEAVLGKDAQALQLLRRARAQGLSYGHWVNRETGLEGVRGTAPFQALARPVPLARD
jgi:tRNA A-37 threonylcarbamoyl transferase component Bud32/tetratricopeptide (TPR) repeat protein